MGRIDRSKYQSIGYKKRAGDARATRVRDEHGRTAGFQVENREGRVAAVVRPQPVRARVRVER